MKVSGRSIGAIRLGTAPLAFKDVSMEQAVATIRAAVDAGVRFIDTALAYTRPGVGSFAEAAVAAALRGRCDRGQIMVATKGGHRRVSDSFPVDASACALRRGCGTAYARSPSTRSTSTNSIMSTIGCDAACSSVVTPDRSARKW